MAQVSPDGNDIYFVKVDRAGLFRLDLSREREAEELAIENLEPVDWNNWEVLARSNYYVRRPEPNEPELARLDLTTGTTTAVRPLPGLLYKSGLWIAPDESEFLFTRVMTNEADLEVLDLIAPRD